MKYQNDHPDDMMIIYLDINEPLDQHINNLDQAIKKTLVWKSGPYKGQTLYFCTSRLKKIILT
ncbi:hypothetical protein BGC07_12380 [Piscirickettsia litoralis]|uniref:Uncharacterized protein n=1 Tax=Piscirickettsia litoralis TaxID=1891921 RepID=A0ABX3A3X5_9GAMM|nr:hypothetical protein BGC07_12380 [Piscirickettsia litoralis]